MTLFVPTITGGKTRAQLVESVERHGFDHFDADRLSELVDDAVSELHNEELWPYREAYYDGACGATIADVAALEYVNYNGARQRVVERRWLEDQYPDLTVEGAPVYFYLDAGQILKSYPVSTVELYVRYWSRYAWETAGVNSVKASADSSECLIPVEWQDLVTLLAVGTAYLEDQQEDTVGYMTRYLKRLERMRETLLGVNRDEPREVRQGFNSWG